MTDKEIIEALECCVDEDCDNCPNCIGMFCIVNLESYALDLINRQQEQLEAAANGQETLQKALADKDREIERLTAEKEQLIKTFGECQAEATKEILKNEKEIERLNNNISAMAVTMRNCAKATRAEAIRAFAERLKQRCSANSDINYYILKKLVDNLVKEMVGDTE